MGINKLKGFIIVFPNMLDQDTKDLFIAYKSLRRWRVHSIILVLQTGHNSRLLPRSLLVGVTG